MIQVDAFVASVFVESLNTISIDSFEDWFWVESLHSLRSPPQLKTEYASPLSFAFGPENLSTMGGT